jgi:competence protein ComGC
VKPPPKGFTPMQNFKLIAMFIALITITVSIIILIGKVIKKAINIVKRDDDLWDNLDNQ